MAKNVTDDLLDQISKHSLDLQRIANRQDRDMSKVYNDLSKELEQLAIKYDYTKPKNQRQRRKAFNKLQKAMRDAIAASGVVIVQAVKKGLVDVAELESEFALGSINKAMAGTGTVQITTGKLDKKRLSAIANEISIQGAPQNEVWARHTRKTQERARDAMNMAWQQNEDLATAVSRIRGTRANGFRDGIMNITKQNANTLARTGIHSVANQVREETYQKNTDVIKGVEFLSHLDNRTTPTCMAYHQSRWEITPEGYRNVKGGHEFRKPPLHFNCRSTLLPVLKTKEELRQDILNQVPKDRLETLGKDLDRKKLSADNWLKTQSKDYQKSVLGSAYGLWTQGKVSFSRFVTQKGRLRTPQQVLKTYQDNGTVPKSK